LLGLLNPPMPNLMPANDHPAPPHSRAAGARGAGGLARLHDAFFGPDPQAREHISRLMRSVWLTLVAVALMGLSSWFGFTPAWALAVTVGYCTVVMLGLYGLMRSSLARHWPAQTMTQVQLFVGITAVVVSYSVADIARGAALQLLCLLLAFEMDRLNQRQLMKASAFAMVMLGLTLLVRVLLWPSQVALLVEVYDLVMAAVLLPLAVVVGGEVSRTHGRQLRQRELLAGTLAQLSALSTRDALTGLANRRHAMSLLEQEHKRQQRGGGVLVVALLDIDWFKRINDLHGHGVGDRVLQSFARVCADALPSDVTLARWGGEEFLLVMPACDAAHALSLVTQLRQRVAAQAWSDLARGLRLSFSAGVASHDATGSLAQTLERADRALYNAKDLGRDRTVIDGQHSVPPARLPDPLAEPPQQQPASAAAAPLSMSQPSMVDTPGLSEHDSQAQGDITLFEAAEPDTGADSQAKPSVWRRLWQRVCRWVLGRDATRREHLRLPLIAMPVHLFWVAMVIGFAIPGQYVGPSQGWTVVAYELSCVLLFYGLIRSGLSARWRDPSLVLEQMLAALTVAAYGYVVAPSLRASLLHLMCVILVFGMVTLRTLASRVAGVYAVLLLAATAFAIWWFDPATAALETIKLGLAGFVLARLAMLSQSYSRVRRDVAVEQKQLSRAVAQVQELVIRDALTGLFNRKHMQDVLAREHDRFKRTGQPYGVVLLDVDHFKKINDLHGHHVGDQVLHGLARHAQACLRQSDVLARWGGEEFLVVMPNIEHAQAGLAALARLRQALAEQPWPVGSGAATPPLRVSFSAGLAQVRAGETIDQLIDRADRALYEAKDSGRNCDVLADLMTGVVTDVPVGTAPGGIMQTNPGTAITV
jgi:diguanylate cyclase